MNDAQHRRRSVRRPLSLLLWLSLVALAASTTGGCAPRVYPPPVASIAKPTAIYLCDYGVHSSLLLPNGDGRFVEYVYGDWAYAAENQTDPLHTLSALFISFDPGLGRRFLTPKPHEVFPYPPNHPNTINPIVVEADKEAAVVALMDHRYQAHIKTAKLNDAPNYGFTFVRDNERYSVFHSCNHLTLRNLRRMGVSVGGYPVLSNFIVFPPGGPFPSAPGPFKMGR